MNEEIALQTKRVLLVHTATAIHAARIASQGFLEAGIDGSVSEAIDLIASCDEFLLLDDEEPAE